jgi:hypothetical protein
VLADMFFPLNCRLDTSTICTLTGKGATDLHGKSKAAGYVSMPRKPQATPWNQVFPTMSAKSSNNALWIRLV